LININSNPKKLKKAIKGMEINPNSQIYGLEQLTTSQVSSGGKS
tara:strand:+ start:82 stop:213 length:132 start_codon:yes stop_codon:yes gene_type:complete